MNMTAKSRYGLKIMMDLADYAEEGHQQRQFIAERQNIPLDFMDQILARLKHAGLIESIRGRTGGVQLKRDAREITLWEILHAVEDTIYPVKCLEQETCDLEQSCISFEAWNDIFLVIKGELSRKTLWEVVSKWKTRKADLPPTAFHSQIKECGRPG